MPPESFAQVIAALMDQADNLNEEPDRPGALALLNAALARGGYEAFYGPTSSATCDTSPPTPLRP